MALLDVPAAAAAPCPDVEIAFARGTTEPPGVGVIGQAFVDSVRSKAGGRRRRIDAVNYPASNDFVNSTPAGRDDASAHIQSMAANCPDTRMVLGGYSQGAAVIDLATTAMPPEVADNVAAAAVSGSKKCLCGRTIPGTFGAHGAYIQSGMVNQAAAFATNRL